MGVTGSGKTTIGQMLAKRLALPFFDADDFHSKENKQKMHNGIPLTDEDRKPWLESISLVLKEEEEKGGAILACSALKESYRQLLQAPLMNKIFWVHLEGTSALITERLKQRTQHFMNPALLASQYETLECPSYAYAVSIDQSPETIVEEILKKLDEWN